MGSTFHASHEVADDQLEKLPDGNLRPVQASDHVLQVSLFDLNLEVGLGLSERSEVSLRLPMRWAIIDAQFHDAEGRELVGYESIHHRDETLSGPADLELWSSYRVLGVDAEAKAPKPSLDVRLGVSLPTGGIEEDPFRLGRHGMKHQHIFFGSGTVDPLLGAGFGLPLAPDWVLGSWASGRFPYATNRLGYRGGIRMAGGASIGTSFGSAQWQVRVGPELFYEQPASWGDGEESVNSGRTDLIAALAADYQITPEVRLNASLKKPFTLHADGGQLSIPFAAIVGVELTLPTWGRAAAAQEPDDHDHGGHDHAGHDHGGHDDHAGHNDHDGHADSHTTRPLAAHPNSPTLAPDVKDLATAGARFKGNGAVPSKRYTVIDFWAEWCKPCHEIDGLLRQLAGHHPDLAIRRVEIVDDDSPALSYIGVDATLPVIWVLDAQGKRVLELRATSAAEVERRLEQLLHGR